MLIATALFCSLATIDMTDQQVYQKVAPCVVQVATTDPGQTDASFSGTGFSVKFGNTRLFLTAAHVVEGATKVYVVLNDHLVTCTVWTDESSDYAVLKPSTQPKGSFLKLSDLRPEIGQDCWVVGYPCPGDTPFDRVLSRGIINQFDAGEERGRTLGISCSLVPGNSGSPIVDRSGNVVGIACSTFGGTELSFGLPVARISKSAIQKWLHG